MTLYDFCKIPGLCERKITWERGGRYGGAVAREKIQRLGVEASIGKLEYSPFSSVLKKSVLQNCRGYFTLLDHFRDPLPDST